MFGGFEHTRTRVNTARNEPLYSWHHRKPIVTMRLQELGAVRMREKEERISGLFSAMRFAEFSFHRWVLLLFQGITEALYADVSIGFITITDAEDGVRRAQLRKALTLA